MCQDVQYLRIHYVKRQQNKAKCSQARFEANNCRDVMDSALETYRDIMQRPLRDPLPDVDRAQEITQIVRAADADIVTDD